MWAVGYLTGPSRTSTVTLRRKGGTWTRAPSPNPDCADQLYGVVTTPAGTWAVGTGTGAGGNSHPLHPALDRQGVEDAAGAARSRRETTRLFGIAGKGSDLWAFGQREKNGGTLHPLALHHAASGWHVSKTPDPAPGGESFLFGGTISGATVWAVGGRGSGPRHALESGTPRRAGRPSQCPTAQAARPRNELTAVVPIPGTKQLWAVSDCSPGLGNETLVEQRRNGAWHQVSSPTPDATGSFLTGVVAFSQTRAAAVGYRTPAGFRTLALIYH